MNRWVIVLVVAVVGIGLWRWISDKEDKLDHHAELLVASALCADPGMLTEAAALVSDGGKSLTLPRTHALCDRFDNALAGMHATVAQRDRVLGRGGKARWEAIMQMTVDQCGTAAGTPAQTAFAVGALPSALLVCRAEGR